MGSSKENQALQPPDQGSQFTVHVDGMDGDVYRDYEAMTHAIAHAFKHGAEKITIKKWPSTKAGAEAGADSDARG
jgi:hypothetical protein